MLAKKISNIIDIFDTEDNISVKHIILDIKILKNRKEKTRHCGYGPGKKSYGHKCIGCETGKNICLSVQVEIDNSGYSYITSSAKTINSLLDFCEPCLGVKFV